MPLLMPLIVLVAVLVARPRAPLLVGAALAALVLEIPAGTWLSNQGGIECPTGCGTGQEVAQTLFFLGLPLTVIVLLAAALLARRHAA